MDLVTKMCDGILSIFSISSITFDNSQVKALQHEAVICVNILQNFLTSF